MINRIDINSKPNAEATVIIDSLTRYLQEINRVPRLTVEEECSLSARVLTGTAAEEALTQGTMDEGTARPLIADGKTAQERLVSANLRLVVLLAKSYQNRGLSLADLIQEGNMGLMKAAAKYDATTGNRFSTCASWWIKQTLSRAVSDQGRMIRLPANMYQQVNRLNRANRELNVLLEREPTPEELAAHLHISVKKVKLLLQYSADATSLDLPVGDEDNGATLGDIAVAVNPIDEVDDSIAHIDLCGVLTDAMDRLDERERLVLELRYGLNGNSVHTLEAAGGLLGLTRERVRQIELKALRRLRTGVKARELKSFIA